MTRVLVSRCRSGQPAGSISAARMLAFLPIALSILAAPALATSAREQAEVLVERGLALDDNSEAEADLYRKAIALDPSYASAHFNLGFVLQKLGRLEEALEAFRECVRRDPSRAEGYYNLGILTWAVRRDPVAARRALNRSIELREPGEDGEQALWEKARHSLAEMELEIFEQKRPDFAEWLSASEIVALLARPIRRAHARGGQTIYLGPRVPLLLFESDSAQIADDRWDQLDELGRALGHPALAGLSFVIEGHTDSRGSWESNQWLSRDRALAVRDALVRLRVEGAGAIEVRVLGEDDPAYPNDSQAHWRMNRRVEVVRADAVWPSEEGG